MLDDFPFRQHIATQRPGEASVGSITSPISRSDRHPDACSALTFLLTRSRLIAAQWQALEQHLAHALRQMIDEDHAAGRAQDPWQRRRGNV